MYIDSRILYIDSRSVIRDLLTCFLDFFIFKPRTMIKKVLYPVIALLLTGALLAFSFRQTEKAEDLEAIKAVILTGYVHGAFNELNPDAMRKSFHPDFAIFSADGEAIKKYPIDTWADGVAERKKDPEFDPADNQWEHNFADIDITGGSAAVKIELSHKGEHVFTDYLSLLKFDSGWRIVAKVYHRH